MRAQVQLLSVVRKMATSPWLTFKLYLTLGLLLSSPAFAAAASAPDPLLALERHRQQLFEQVAPAVVYLSSRDGFGSGFFVSEQGLVLTNAHVVQGGDSVEVVLHDGRRLRGQVVERATDDIDLALVQVEIRRSPSLALGGVEALRVGSWVASVGHGMGGIWSLNTGIVSNVYADGNAHPVFQTQIPLNPGNSGGPVLDRAGRVVGVVTKGIAESNAINFAIRSDVALRSLPRLGGASALLTVEAPDGVPVFVDGKLAGKGPLVQVAVAPGRHEVFAVVQGKMRKREIAFPRQSRVRLR